MSHYQQQAGKVVVVFSDNAMGKRLLIGAREGGHIQPITLATTQAEADDVIRVLRDMKQDLPKEQQAQAPIQLPGRE